MSTKIISRDLINKNIEFTDANTDITYTYPQLLRYINQIKTYLIKVYKVKAGQSIMLFHSHIHIAWIYACAELGLILVIAHHPLFKSKILTDRVKELFGKLDYLAKTPDGAKDAISYYYDNSIDLSAVECYTNTECADIVYATPKSILVRAISESIPARITSPIQVEEHTHEFMYDLLDRNANVFNIQPTDVCLHTKLLHHGPMFGEFFLPSIKHSEKHIWYLNNNLRDFNCIFKYNINRLTLIYEALEDFKNFLKTYKTTFTSHEWDILKNLHIHLIRSPTKKVVELLVQEYGIRFTITFGSTATVGPLLIQTIDKSNYQLYNQYNFYELTDEFYTLSIVDDKLTVEMPTGKIVSLNDTFNYTQGIYQFKLT